MPADIVTEEYRATSAKAAKSLKTTALRAYKSQKQKSAVDDQILELLPMVSAIANRAVAYLKPPLAFEDIIAAGTVGLVKAARDYNPAKQAEFKTYAFIRIKGAILDELKKWAFLSPEMAKQVSTANQTAAAFERQTGTVPTDEQLAEELGVSADKLGEILQNNRAKLFLSLDATEEHSCSLLQNILCDKQNSPHQNIEEAELTEQLAAAITELPEKKRQIIILYYQQHLTMKQIAQVLEVTESRVSQLHASAIFNLSGKLRRWKNA